MKQSPYRTDRDAAFEWADRLFQLRDVDGDKVGDVAEANPDYLVVETDGGFLGLGERHRYYVPLSETSRDPEGDYRLSVDKDDIERMAWTEPPVDATWASPESRAQLRSDYPGYDEERADATRLIRWEEELQASKTDQQVGEVAVRKHVVEETRTSAARRSAWSVVP